MRFKLPHMKAQFDELPKALKQVCEDFCRLSKKFGVEPVVTRVSDPVAGESGVHLAKRAVDFRDQTSDGRRLYTDEQVKEIVVVLNRLHERTDGKPTCYHHAVPGSTFHFHLQVPPGSV